MSGTLAWGIDTTNDMGYAATPMGPQDPTPKPAVAIVLAGSSIAVAETLTSAVTGFRYTITSGQGTLTAQSTQAGIING